MKGKQIIDRHDGIRTNLFQTGTTKGLIFTYPKYAEHVSPGKYARRARRR